MSERRGRTGSRIRRTPILVALALVLVAAIVFQERDTTGAAGASAVRATAASPAVPESDALSTSWFCAEGTSTPDGRADETVLVASVADTEVEATVTVMAGAAAAPVSRTLHLAPREEQRVRVADLAQAAEPGVVVEVTGGPAAVAHEIRAFGDVATEPCARSASTRWYFAAGTTLRGAQQYVSLFNPFGDDAVVDLTFVTDSGVQEPDDAQAVIVSRRSRVSVPVHDLVPRQRDVAVQVVARSGRVVAERSQLFDGTASDGEIVRHGVALSLGAQQAERSWYVANGTRTGSASAMVGVANFGNVATTAEVSVVLEGDLALPAQSVPVSARSVAMVDVTQGVPADTDYAVVVRARDAEGHSPPVVAEMLQWWPDESPTTGVATSMGSTRPARRWVIALPSGAVDGVVTVVNVGTEPLTAGLLVLDAGDTTGPPSEPERAVDADRFRTFVLDDLDAGGDHVLVVTTDRPSVVGVTYTGDDGAAMSAAVPDFTGR
jgi:hypothetical protein